MEIAAQIIAAVLGIVLLAIAIAHLLWSVGIMWPIRDEALLARTVTGFPGRTRMPAGWKSFGVFVLAAIACTVAFAVADPVSGGLGLTLAALVCGLVFLARGVLGYTAWWAARTPEEPFRSYDRKTYSPLCLLLGAGFVVLVLMRL